MSNGLTGVWCYTEPVHITVDMVHYLIHFRFKKKKKKRKDTEQHLDKLGVFLRTYTFTSRAELSYLILIPTSEHEKAAGGLF